MTLVGYNTNDLYIVDYSLRDTSNLAVTSSDMNLCLDLAIFVCSWKSGFLIKEIDAYIQYRLTLFSQLSV